MTMSEKRMDYAEFRLLWDSLSEQQKESVRLKANWEHMTVWAICNEWPNIWKDEQRLATINRPDYIYLDGHRNPVPK